MSYSVVMSRSAVTVVRAVEALLVRQIQGRTGAAHSRHPRAACSSMSQSTAAGAFASPEYAHPTSIACISGKINVTKEDVRTAKITWMKFDSQVYSSLQGPAVRGGHELVPTKLSHYALRRVRLHHM